MQALLAGEGNRIRGWCGLTLLWLMIVWMDCVIFTGCNEATLHAATTIAIKRESIAVSSDAQSMGRLGGNS